MKMVLGLCLITACSTTMSPGGGDDDGGGGDWTAIPLVDDGSVQRSGNDLVTGIYFASPDDGYVVTQGDMGSFGDGGAVFKASGTAVKSIAFSGMNGGPSELGGVDFVGVDPTPTGIIAFAYSADVVQSTDHGATFTIVKDGNLAGIEPALAQRVSSSGTTIVRETGVVSTATSAPGPSASFTDIWAPNASPTIPEPVPPAECQGGPLGTGAPVTRSSVYVSGDRQTIAYTSCPDHDPQICVSTDGGTTFTPSILAGIPDTAVDVPPTGIAFANATTAVTFWGSQTESGSAYIQRSTDGGKTWQSVALPAAVASHGLQLTYGFFAPDGQHGWIVGYDGDASTSLVLSTTDGGATWATEAITGENKLYSGFALDATHVWIGGAAGTLLTHS
jgi:photosystem II stability/assembly factor-like uncharacterized protein